ncbi:zinc finger, CCHC-type containing protein [Tanacetum coccineum]
MITTPESCLYYTAMIRYTAYGIVKLPVKSSQPSHQVFGTAAWGVVRERTRLLLFQFSLRDQASNWLERLPARSITTWEDLTTRFLAHIFPPRRTTKLCNDILMLEDQINFLLKGSRPTPRPSSTHVPQAYGEAVYSDPHLQNLNVPP